MAFTGKFTTIGTVPTWDGEKFVSRSIAELGAADIHVSYVVLAATSSLANERILSGGLGIGFSDGGGGQPVILSASIVGGTNITIDSLGNSIRINATSDISAGADPNASYILLGNTASLNNERALAAGLGLGFTDGGPNSNVTLSASIVAGPGIVVGSQGNSIAVSSSLTTFDPDPTYVVLNATSSLNNERVLTAGLGLGSSDGGAGGNLTLSASVVAGPGISVDSVGNSIRVNNTQTTFDPDPSYVVLAATSSLNSERVLATGLGLGFTDGGSGNSVTLSASIVGGTGITVDSVNNSIRINSSQTTFDPDPSYLVLGATSSLNNERVFTPGVGLGYADSGAGNNLTLSASIVAGAGIAVDSVNNSIRVATTVTTFDPDPSYVVLAATSSLNNERVLATGLGLGYSDSGSGNNVTLSASIVAGTGVSVDSVGNSIRVNNTQTTFDPDPSYIVLASTSSLNNERVLATGLGLGFTDAGANSTVTLSASIVAGPGITVGTQGNSIAISSSLTTFDPNPSYVVLGTTSSLVNERVLTTGLGLGSTDGGANGNITLSASIIAGPNITVGTQGNSITISGSTFADKAASYLVVGTTSSLDNERSFAAGVGIGFSDAGADSTFTVSASVVAGPGITIGTQGNSIAVSSSLTTFDPNPSYVVLATTSSLANERVLSTGLGLGLTDGGANGNVTLSASIVAGTGVSIDSIGNSIRVNSTQTTFDPNPSYVVLGATSSLANERILTAGVGLGLADSGAGSAITLSASLVAGPGVVIGTQGNSIAISSSLTTFDPNPSYVVLATTSSLANERVLATGLGLGFTDGGANGNVTVSASVIAGNGISVDSVGNSIRVNNTQTTFDPDPSYLVLGATSSLNNERVFTPGLGLGYSDAAGVLTLSASIVGGTNVTVDSVGNSVRINAAGGGIQFVEGTPSPRLRTTASLAVGNDSVFAENIGSNVNFYVSGTVASSAKSAVFGGRLVVSGNLVVGDSTIQDGISRVIVGGNGNIVSASSTHAFIGGGESNTVDSSRSAVVAGRLNRVVNSTDSAILVGSGSVISNSLQSFIGAGESNVITTSATGSFIGGGFTNRVDGSKYSGIVFGGNNFVYGDSEDGGILGGASNTVSASQYAAIVAGLINDVTSSIYGAILAGNGNSVYDSSHGTTISGLNNKLRTSAYSMLLGGIASVISSSQTSLAFGSSNQIVGSDTSVVAGGANNVMTLNRLSNSTAREGNVIGGGSGNQLTTLGSFMTIAGGSGNRIAAGESTSAGTVAGNGAFIGGGTSNLIVIRSATTQTDASTAILGGSNNTVMVTRVGSGSAIVGGVGNFISGTNASTADSALKGGFIGGGFRNAISSSLTTGEAASFNAIVAGTDNSITNKNYNFIGGGNTNAIFGASVAATSDGRHFIGGGEFNDIDNGGSGSVIVGGARNYISGTDTATRAAGSFIGGGFRNQILTTIINSSGSFIGGGINNNLTNQLGSAVVGGANNVISGSGTASAGSNLHNVLVGGQSNVISSSSTTAGTHIYNFIGGGNANRIAFGSYGTIVNGLDNRIDSVSFTAGLSLGQFIGGGRGNQIIGTRTSGSLIVGGTFNTISASSTATFGGNLIGGGQQNSILGAAGSEPQFSVIVGGSGSILNNQYNSALVGGENNRIIHEGVVSTGGRHFLGGGTGNSIIVYGSGSAIVGGASNVISGASTADNRATLSFIGGGQQNSILGTSNQASRFNVLVGGDRNILTNTEHAFIGGGFDNLISAGNTSVAVGGVIVGGRNNEISGSAANTAAFNDNAIVGGITNAIIAQGNFACEGNVVIGGFSNRITVATSTGHDNIIGAGESNIIFDSFDSVVNGGVSNAIRGGQGSFIGGGRTNSISGSAGSGFNDNMIGAGESNTILSSNESVINGGTGNSISGGEWCFIGGGRTNVISGAIANFNDDNLIVGGFNNAITSSTPGDLYRNSVLGGENNRIVSTGGTATHKNTIVGGIDNTITNASGTFIIGNDTTVTSVNSAVVFGVGLHGNIRNSSAVNGNITVLDQDVIINVTQNTSASFSINTTGVKAGRILYVLNTTGASKTINSITVADDRMLTLISDGTNWIRAAT